MVHVVWLGTSTEPILCEVFSRRSFFRLAASSQGQPGPQENAALRPTTAHASLVREVCEAVMIFSILCVLNSTKYAGGAATSVCFGLSFYSDCLQEAIASLSHPGSLGPWKHRRWNHSEDLRILKYWTANHTKDPGARKC